MALSFTQTDAQHATCTTSIGSSVTSPGLQRQATNGGAAGSSAVTVTITDPPAAETIGSFMCVVPNGTTGASGNWELRLNCTAENMFITWDGYLIRRLNSSCAVQETLGSGSGLGISLSTTGVKSTTASGVSAPSALNDGDIIEVSFTFNSTSMNAQSVDITPDQDIDSPFTATVDASTLVDWETKGDQQPIFQRPTPVGYRKALRFPNLLVPKGYAYA